MLVDSHLRLKTQLPLVTIVVPVFNAAPYLRDSLDSIVGQSFPDTEILVMDDASTDQSPEIIGEYGEKLVHHRQPRNRGQFANVNDGIALARGEYVCVYHADDIYESTIVEREVNFLQRHPEAGAVFCLDAFIDAGGNEYGRLSIPPELRTGKPLPYEIILNALLTYKNRFLVGPTSMVRASVYRTLGPYRGEEFRIASDLEMWARIAKIYPIGILLEHLHRYRHGHGNLSQNYYRLRNETEIHFKILDAHLADGGRALVTPHALADHEAHRAEDRLMVAINEYIRDNQPAAQQQLRNIRLQQLWGSAQVQGFRLSILLMLLRLLTRVPRIAFIADLFYHRWHGVKSHPRKP